MSAALLLIALSATAAPAAPPPGGSAGSAYSSGCIASLREFAYELSTAVEVGDANRLAALYRWRGTPTRAGYSIMERLEVLAGRPLLQVHPVYPPPAPAEPPSSATTAMPIAAFPADAPAGFDPVLLDPPRHGPPIGLRLEQTLADGTTPASTTLWLRRELGCWWVTF